MKYKKGLLILAGFTFMFIIIRHNHPEFKYFVIFISMFLTLFLSYFVIKGVNYIFEKFDIPRRKPWWERNENDNNNI